MGEQSATLWQNGILGAAALFLLLEIYGGWRRGLIRSALHFGTFVGSGIIGLVAGKTVSAAVAIILPGLAFVSGVLAGITTGIATLSLCLFFSALLFKRTSQQPPGIMRLIFGLGGAFFGLLTGLFILWGSVSLIRTSGALAKANSTTPAISHLSKIKNALETGPAGGLVESIDIISPETYTIIQRVGSLSKNPEAMMRFLDYPEVQQIVGHPRMVALLQDQGIIQAAERKDMLTIMQNRLLHEAVVDPDLQRLVISLDLQKALDYALPDGQDSTLPQP